MSREYVVDVGTGRDYAPGALTALDAVAREFPGPDLVVALCMVPDARTGEMRQTRATLGTRVDSINPAFRTAADRTMRTHRRGP